MSLNFSVGSNMMKNYLYRSHHSSSSKLRFYSHVMTTKASWYNSTCLSFTIENKAKRHNSIDKLLCGCWHFLKLAMSFLCGCVWNSDPWASKDVFSCSFVDSLSTHPMDATAPRLVFFTPTVESFSTHWVSAAMISWWKILIKEKKERILHVINSK